MIKDRNNNFLINMQKKKECKYRTENNKLNYLIIKLYRRTYAAKIL